MAIIKNATLSSGQTTLSVPIETDVGKTVSSVLVLDASTGERVMPDIIINNSGVNIIRTTDLTTNLKIIVTEV